MSNTRNTLEELVEKVIRNSNVALMNRLFDSEVQELRDAIVTELMFKFSRHLNRKAKPGVIFVNENAELLGRAKTMFEEISAGSKIPELDVKDWLEDAEETNLKFI